MVSKTLLNKEHVDGAKAWLKLMKSHDLDKEKQSYPDFMNIILGKLFGVGRDREQPPYYTFEETFSEFVIKDGDGSDVCCIEAKGMTQDLDKPQHRSDSDKTTPIRQLWGYMGDDESREFGICTNYRHFILITKKSKVVQHRFDFGDVDLNGMVDGTEVRINEEKLKEFVGIFVDGVLDGRRITNMRRKAIMWEKAVTDEFYALYHETRLMLIHGLEKNGIDRRAAYNKAQTILNRLLFMFFVVDKKIVPINIFRENMRGLLRTPSLFTETSTRLYDEINTMFDIFKKGDVVDGKRIPKFNGGLFEEDLERGLILDNVKPGERKGGQHAGETRKRSLGERDKDLIALMRGLPNLNPVFENLLLMDSYDFTSELSVNILGHVFEQSLADLTNMFESEISQRKAEGAYYTPDGMTEHLCRNTIIPYLSKSGTVNDADDLVMEYGNDVESLEKKFNSIKILDPSCGSGAFLLKAVEILLEVSAAIRGYKEQQGSYRASDVQENLDAYNEEVEASRIIQDNIYGVDLNPQAVDIARLSMFFKLVSDGSLPSLEKNIKYGNSLISPDDTSKIKGVAIRGSDMDKSAFDWRKSFPEVVSNGFDIVIGNPPWDKTKGTSVEFYAPYYDSVHTDRFRTRSESSRRTFVRRINTERPDVHAKYKHYIETRKRATSFFTKSDAYEFQGGNRGVGDSNFYKLFMERAFKLLKPGGMLGYVVPIAFCMDSSDSSLRRLLVVNGRMRHMLGFINTAGAFFHDVHKQQKFCVFVMEKTTTDGDYGFDCRFKIEDPDAFMLFGEPNGLRMFEMDTKLIKMSKVLAIPEITTRESMLVFKKLYDFDTIGQTIRTTSEVHMSRDKRLFHEVDAGHVPLYEGKHITHFRICRPVRYFIGADDVRRISAVRYWGSFRIVWRDITNAIDSRTLYATIMPKDVLVANTLNYVVPDGGLDKMAYVCGMLNSFVMDFFFRQRVNLHVSQFILKDAPMPAFDSENTLHRKIVETAACLVCGYDKERFADLRDSLVRSGYNVPVVTDADQLFALEITNTAYVAVVYGLDEQDLDTVLDSFTKTRHDKGLEEMKQHIRAEFIVANHTAICDQTQEKHPN